MAKPEYIKTPEPSREELVRRLGEIDIVLALYKWLRSVEGRTSSKADPILAELVWETMPDVFPELVIPYAVRMSLDEDPRVRRYAASSLNFVARLDATSFLGLFERLKQDEDIEVLDRTTELALSLIESDLDSGVETQITREQLEELLAEAQEIRRAKNLEP